MTRAEHLAWAKERALAYLEPDQLNLVAASSSFVSDLGKHDETRGHPALELLAMETVLAVRSNDCDAVRRCIEGFR